MEKLLTISWPGACVLIAMIFGFVVLLTDWPTLFKKTTNITNHYHGKEDEPDGKSDV